MIDSKSQPAPNAIRVFWAYVRQVEQLDGMEAVVAAPGFDGKNNALMFIGDSPPHSFHAMAQDYSDAHGVTMHLIRLSVRSDIHTVAPGGVPFSFAKPPEKP